ncbi:nucleotidyltransferase domain-containing protein [Roseomonas sp. CCTCC AB2023176]|uniref:nucleotidyltransferase domain-containing protein n=1 Tax=Roseomonas sp. CCTCC AB2023176 TaxID=3342640 RepID=UPI0035D90475
MRLTPAEIAAVKRIVTEVFGPEATVRVFGSRARLDVRGGDLDLLVEVPRAVPDDLCWQAQGRIERALDDLSTDLIVRSRDREPLRIECVAAETGIPL